MYSHIASTVPFGGKDSSIPRVVASLPQFSASLHLPPKCHLERFGQQKFLHKLLQGSPIAWREQPGPWYYLAAQACTFSLIRRKIPGLCRVPSISSMARQPPPGGRRRLTIGDGRSAMSIGRQRRTVGDERSATPCRSVMPDYTFSLCDVLFVRLCVLGVQVLPV